MFARIGQCFSTTKTIMELDPACEIVLNYPEIERPKKDDEQI